MSKFKSWLSFLCKVALGLGLFLYVCTTVSWGDIYSRFLNVSPLYLIISFAIVFLQAFLLGLRWRQIGLQLGIAFSSLEYTRSILISFFFSQGLPASLGSDAFRIWWYAQRGIKTAEGLKVVAFDRIVGLVSLALVCSTSVLIFVSMATHIMAVNSLTAVVVISLFCFFSLLLPFRLGVTAFLTRQCDKLPYHLSRLLAWLIDMREFFRRGSRTSMAGILILGVGVHLLTVALGYCLGLAFGSNVGFLACLAAIAPALLFSYIPISIAGWGVREATFVFAFGLIGVDRETALLISLGIGFVVLLVSLFGGILWFVSGMRSSYRSATLSDPECY